MAQISPANSGGFSIQMSRDYTGIFFDQYRKWPAMWSKVAKLDTSDGKYEREASISPLSIAQTIREGDGPMFVVPEEGHEKLWYHTKYGLGFQITEEAKDDDRRGKLRAMPKNLSVSIRWKQEVTFWDLWNSGDDTHTCGDGMYVFDTARPLLNSGSTWANMPATEAALTETSFEAGLQHFKDLVNHAGMPVMDDPYLLLIPPDLEFMARRILRSNLMPGTANNDINPVKGEVEYLVVPWLTSATIWSLISRSHDARFMWRKKVRFQSGDDFRTGNALFKTTGRWSNVVVDPHGLYLGKT